MTQWMHGGSDDESEPSDPRVIAENRVREAYDHMDAFERATMRWLLGLDGWTETRALAVRQREWQRR